MSEEQLKAFLEMVKGYTSLQEKLNSASDAEAVSDCRVNYYKNRVILE
jgi:predicted ribosomally synthesized peptide with nif11-like leader